MKYLAFIAILTFISTPCFAQMNYVATPQRPVAPKAPTAEITQTADTPSDRVWRKYKALAGETPPPVQSITPHEKLRPRLTDAQKPAPKATGFAALINQYKANQQSRSQMHTLTIEQPQ